LIGRIGRVATTREYVVTGTPFLFVYRVEPSKIVILRLLHTAQNYP
jgi:toxin ParE1/3/4